MDTQLTDDRRNDALRTLPANYFSAWSTTDSSIRRDLVDRVYSVDAEFFSSEDRDLRLQGRAAIAENIGQVNARDVQGNGLVIEHTGTAFNHGMARVTWRMVAGDGTVALTGMNLLMLDSSGSVAQDFIFLGAVNEDPTGPSPAPAS